VDREPVRDPESRPTTNESWRAQVSIRACGATQPASKERLRRYSTRGTVRAERYPTRIPEATPRGAGRRRSEGGGFRYAPAALLNPQAGAACSATQPASKGRLRAAQPAGSSGPRRYSTRGEGRRAALLNPTSRCDISWCRGAQCPRPQERGREAGGFRYAPAALLNPRDGATCGATQPASKGRLRRYSTRGTGGDLRRYSTGWEERCAAVRGARGSAAS
jgi:hypothetical protein